MPVADPGTLTTPISTTPTETHPRSINDHRDVVQRDLDIQRAVELHHQGKTTIEIAAAVGVTHQQVSDDLREARRRWREATIAEIGQIIAEEYGQLEHVRQQAWTGWYRSLRENGKAPEGRDGRPEFLEIILRTNERVCDLLGASADRSVDVSDYLREEAIKHGLDPSVVIAEAKRYQLLLAGGDPEQSA